MTRFFSCVPLMLLILLWLPACVAKAPEKSQLEIRQMQTRTFRTTNKTQVMQAVTDALLDDGYIIEQTNNKLGLINAQKKQTRTGIPRDTQEIYALTAQVRTQKDRSRVRLNIQRTTASTEQDGFFNDDVFKTRSHRHQYSSRVTNPKIYRRLFNKIDKSLFIEQEVYEEDSAKNEDEDAPSDTNDNAPGDGEANNQTGNPSNEQEQGSDSE